MKKFTAPILLLCIFTASQRVGAQYIYPFAGTGAIGYTGDGHAATAAELSGPQDVAFDASGNLYFPDHYNNCIRKVNTSGVITTIAGNGTPGYSGDGGAATAAELYYPSGVAVDRSGNIYIADLVNNVVRKVNTSGIISTIAGNGSGAYTGDGGPATAAGIFNPQRVVVDTSGNIFVADWGHSMVRKVNTAGIISTFAGSTSVGYGGDGGAATAAQLNSPFGLALDRQGNLYIADEANSAIRKVNTAGIITTVAGIGLAGYSGDGGPATSALLADVTGVVLDTSGNMYITDEGNNRVRRVDTAGIINTFAGNGTGGYSGDNIPATTAELFFPYSAALDALGNVYIADETNNRIREVAFITAPIFTGGSPQSFTICENSGPYPINSLLTVTDHSVAITDTFSVIAAPAHGAITMGSATIAGGTAVSPTGWAYTPTTGYSGTDAFTVQVNNGRYTAGTVINVVVDPLPVAGTISGYDTICLGHTYTFSDTVAGGVWSSSNTSVATVSSTGIVNCTGMGSDTITYEVTNSCGAAIANYIIYKVNPCEGAVIPVNNPESAINLFPDPNTGTFTINLSSQYDEDVQVVILNAVGEKMKELTTMTNRETPVSITAAAGIYIVQARIAKGVYTAKLIVQ